MKTLRGRRRILFTLATFLAAGWAAPLMAQTRDEGRENRPIVYPDSAAFGAYDPHGDFADDRSVKIEALFLPWQDVDLTTLREADGYARQRGRTLLITVEPWTWSKTEHVSPPALLQGIMSGRYDGNIAAICDIVGTFKTPTTMRWAQEMEDPRLRFSWQGWTGPQYVGAYRHFVDHCRASAPRAKFMWSPKGLPGLESYYPGDAYVDSIGLSVFGLQPYDRDTFGRDRTFTQSLKTGYDLVTKYNKPICVAELGYVGKIDYVRDWAENTLKPDPGFPRLDCLVYFDDKEVAPWPRYGLPDWRVTSNVLP
jgi:beta-mannanase